MRGRPRKTPANDVQTRQAKWGARDAQSAAAKAAGHQGAETSDGAQPGADVARDAAEVAGTAQTGPEMAGDEPGDGVESVGEGEEAGHVSRETGGAGTAGEPGDAQTHQREGEAVVASEVPALDTDAALALRRLRERPLCCCGCGQVLSSPKRHFIQGHDGKAKVIVRKIMRGELKPQDAPPQLTLGHSEIKFIMRSPEFRRVAEMWREICGLTLGRGAMN